MSTRPRNPRYFPRMKVRGARRRREAPLQRLAGAFVRVGELMAQSAESFAEAFRHLRSVDWAELPATVHQFDGERLETVPSTEVACDSPEPGERHTQ